MTRYAKHTKIRIILHHAPMNDECFFFNYPIINKESHKPAKQPWLGHIKYIYIYIILYHIIPYIRIISIILRTQTTDSIGTALLLGWDAPQDQQNDRTLRCGFSGHRGNTKQDWPVLFYHNLNSDFTFVFLGVALSNGDVASNSRGDLTGIMVNL